MDVKYQVFVSSTFSDLKEERRKVSEAILNMGHIPVGMEAFNASDVSQWKYITDRIDECDYYVVLVAERYGSEREGKSYTQLEYEYACAKGMPVTAFLLSPDVRTSWPVGHVESKKMLKINKFRALCEKKIVKYWVNSDDLAAKVYQSLSHEMKVNPRTGWIRADVLPSRQVLQELSALSEERRVLQDKVAILESNISGMKIPQEYSWKIKKLKSLTIESVLDYAPSEESINLYDLFDSICNIMKNMISSSEVYEFIGEMAAYKLDNYDCSRVMEEFIILDLLDVKIGSSDEILYYTLTSTGKSYLMYSEILSESEPSEEA